MSFKYIMTVFSQQCGGVPYVGLSAHLNWVVYNEWVLLEDGMESSFWAYAISIAAD